MSDVLTAPCGVWFLTALLSVCVFPGMEPAPTADPAASYPSPSDLRFSRLGPREVKLHWTSPAKAVQQYRVVYHSAESRSPQEVGDPFVQGSRLNKKWKQFDLITLMLVSAGGAGRL